MARNQETQHNQPKLFNEEGSSVDGQTPILSSIIVSEEIRSKLFYDNCFNDYDIEIENRATGRRFVRGISLDIPRMEQFVEQAKDLMENINRGGELVYSGKNIHIGFRIYLCYSAAEGEEGVYCLRKYCYIEQKEVPIDRGVCIKRNTFGLLLDTIEHQISLAEETRHMNEYVIYQVIEMHLRQGVLELAKHECRACQRQRPPRHPQHVSGCMAGWLYIVQNLFNLHDYTPNLAAEVETTYRKVIPKIQNSGDRSMLAHGFAHVYDTYFTNDADTIEGYIISQPYSEDLEMCNYKVLDEICAAMELSANHIKHFHTPT